MAQTLTPKQAENKAKVARFLAAFIKGCLPWTELHHIVRTMGSVRVGEIELPNFKEGDEEARELSYEEQRLFQALFVILAAENGLLATTAGYDGWKLENLNTVLNG